MKAIIYNKFQGDLLLKEVESPSPEVNGVVIKVKATGLCLSDWHGWMGHDKDIVLPHVPGHELAGEIVAKGKNVKKFNIGDRVTLPFVGGCGVCEQCETDNHQICDYQFQPGFTHWGSFAEYVSIKYADINLVKLPDAINFETAASLGCRFATSFRAIIDQGKVCENQWVVIHGCGGVGLSAIMIAVALGARVIAVDVNEDTLNFAKSLGAYATINALNIENVHDIILEITKGGAHVSLDALGNPEIIFNSISSLRKRGKHIQVGILTPDLQDAKIPTDLIIAKELEILGSHGMQAFRYDAMIDMITSGQLNPERLISEKIFLSEVIYELPKMNEFKNRGIKIINAFN